MGNKVDNKFTWVIKNFPSLQSKHIYSYQFVIGGCKWRLLAYPKGDIDKSCLTLYLVVADSKTLPCGWRRHAKFSLTIVNQISETLSQMKKAQQWFDQKTPAFGFPKMFPLAKLHPKDQDWPWVKTDRSNLRADPAEDGGFLVNGEVKIIVEIKVLEVIGKLEETQESNQPLKKIKREKNNDDFLNETPPVKESIDVNGFQVFPSQVEFVSRVFRKYPGIALELRAKNQPLRSACLYVFLGLIETLCKSLQELSNDDLMEADNALTYLKTSGFKVDWLEKKLVEVKEKKKEEQIGETRMQELEEELKVFKQKCLDIEALLGKEKAKVLAARAPALTLDEVV